ncbi:MAG: UvrD-helicase domain-containing protein [Candidatus Udaeobacter sp.]
MANLDEVYAVDDRAAAFEKHQRGILVCLAGPGTGKTYSLLERTVALTAQKFEPDSICYLTFIKEITNAFVADYIDKFGLESYETSAPRISTLHSFACRLIRNQGFRIGYEGELYFANVADNGEVAGQTFLSDLFGIINHDDCPSVARLRDQVDSIKGAWRDDEAPAKLPPPGAAIFKAASDLLRSFRLVDWDQTVPLARELFRDRDLRPQWMKKIRHYFVDEYQDFNRAEQTLIGLLAADADSTVIVGDDDQSVYSQRGGSPEGMRVLYENPEYDHVSLIKCRRCKEKLVDSANTFQAKMSAHPRPMVAACNGGQVVCYRFKSSKAEVAFLTDYLLSCLEDLPEEPKPKEGIACLFPSHRVLENYYEMLSPKVPCVQRNISPQSNRLWLERLLQLVKKPQQRFLQRLLLRDYAELKPRHRCMIVRRILERDMAPSDACASLLLDGLFKGKAVDAARAFCDTYDAIAAHNLERIASVVSPVLGVKCDLVVDQLKKLDDSEDDQAQDDVVATICDSLLPDTATPSADLKAVLFLTMHGSKGLTKKTVVIPGLEQAWMPGNAEGGALAERQRLFYVAMTRATDNVVITFPHNRGGNDSLNFPMQGRGAASSFIACAGLSAHYHE